jgi:hypothetical protein
MPELIKNENLPKGVVTNSEGGYNVTFEDIHVAVATPCYGNIMVSQYARSLAMTGARFQSLGIGFDLMFLANEALIEKGRNSLVAAFLESKATHLWFVDADMGWEPDAIVRLIGAMKVGGFEMAAAAGPRKATPTSFCLNFPHQMERDNKTGYIEALTVGTGFMVLTRSCVEKMVAASADNFFVDPLSGKKIHRLFECKIDEHRQFWSEDYTFCNKWRDIGGKIHIDFSVKLEHVGNHVWAGALQEQLSPWAGSLTGRMG